MGPPAPLRVVVADHHDAYRAGLARAVDRHPDLVLIGEAATGGQALDAIRALTPHAALVDAGLRDLDGLEVCRRVRRDPLTASVRLVLSATESTRSLVALAGELDVVVVGRERDREELIGALLRADR